MTTPNQGDKAGQKKGHTPKNAAIKSTINDTPLPVRLSEEEINFLLRQIPEGSKQARRLIPALGRNPDSPTNRLNKGSGVNLSHIRRTYNPYLIPYGYCIQCRTPPEPIINAFGEKSGQQLWGIYRVNGGS